MVREKGNQRSPKQVGTDAEAVVVACHQNQCRQNFNAPLLPSGQYCGHGGVIFAWRPEAPPHFPVWKHLQRNPLRRKKRQKKSIFIHGTTFKKNKSGSDFQRVQIWNNQSQKQKKNYDRHPITNTHGICVCDAQAFGPKMNFVFVIHKHKISSWLKIFTWSLLWGTSKILLLP